MTRPLRKKYLINPSYQLRFAATVFLYVICYSVIFGFVLFYPLYDMLSSATGIEEEARIAATILYLHKRFWIGLFAIAVIIAIQAVFGTHRVVGPVYRFARTVESFIAGQYIRIRIRKGDEFKEMQGLLNRLSETLEGKAAADDAARADAVKRLEALRDGIEASDGVCPPEARRELEALIKDISSPRQQRGRG